MEDEVTERSIQQSSNFASLPMPILTWFDNNSNDMFSVWDKHGKCLFFSKSMERILGFKTSEFQNISWMDIVSPDDVNDLKIQFDNLVIHEQIFHINIKNKNESYNWCKCKIKKHIDEKKQIPYYLVVMKDVTDKKEIEEMVIRSEKMSVAGQLAAGVAHEIRNPLTSIKGFLQLLEAGVDRKDVYYKIMVDEIEKIEKITSELLYISKPLTDQKKEENVDKMIEDVVNLLKSQAKLKNITIKHVQSENAMVLCDRSQIKQVLLNLIKNAIEALEDNGMIHVVVKKINSKTQVDVIDEGPGISEEIIHKLGEPFFTTKPNGTGLGLMITKQILERHDARLEIFHNEVKGSTFRIIFNR